eukprot:863026-Rhodomonas_salina.2
MIQCRAKLRWARAEHTFDIIVPPSKIQQHTHPPQAGAHRVRCWQLWRNASHKTLRNGRLRVDAECLSNRLGRPRPCCCGLLLRVAASVTRDNTSRARRGSVALSLVSSASLAGRTARSAFLLSRPIQLL